MRARVLAAALIACTPKGAPEAPTQPSAQAVQAPATPSAAPVALTPKQIATRAMPSIVTVRSAGGLGTGFVVRSEGWIATNVHVIAHASELRVVLPDKSEHPVLEIIAFDLPRDLVLLRIDAGKLPVLPLGDSHAVEAGDPVVAIGHPLGLEDTVSNGLVSAVRVIDSSMTVLQISAPIAPGSSGGPLLDDRGQVIGVAAAVSRQGQNLNFGIPSAYLQALVDTPNPISLAAFGDKLAAFAPRASPRQLPHIARHVPKHELGVLRACSDGDMRLLVTIIEGAIDVGAPLYNAGNFAACYHIYEGAALDAERRLSPSCQGPRQALAAGRKRASAITDPNDAAQAWALRDAFDGLLDVMRRKMHGE